jgi:hypothetical protein
MVHLPRRWSTASKPLGHALHVSRWVLALAVLCVTGSARAQGPRDHYQHQASMTPGAIGSWQLRRGGPLPGYFQPVEIKAPPGALVSLAVRGRFDELLPAPRTAGMLIAPVYRLRVAGIPHLEGQEVFPTIEIIDRLYPPIGQAHRFPIVVELTAEDLELAVSGRFVTRVIYLEDPERAAPTAEDNFSPQRWFDCGADEDPLRIADTIGRPVAILRMGARWPDDPDNPSPDFLYGSPPWVEVPAPREGAPPEELPPARPDARDGAMLFDAPPRMNGGPFLR